MNLCIDDLMDRVLDAKERENRQKTAYISEALGAYLPEVVASVEDLEHQVREAADNGDLCGEFKINPLHAFVLMWEFRVLRPVVRVDRETLTVFLSLCWDEECENVCGPNIGCPNEEV